MLFRSVSQSRYRAAENPDLIDDLAVKAKGKKLTDMFARDPNTPSQARSLEKILAKRGMAQAEAPVEAPVRRATSIGMAPGDVPVPPMGETTPSVAPTGLPEASMPPVETPETQVTATTPEKQVGPNVIETTKRALNTIQPLAERWLKDKPETDLRGYAEYLAEGRVGDLSTNPMSAEILAALNYLDRIHGIPVDNRDAVYRTKDGELIDLGEKYLRLLRSEQSDKT